VRKVRRGGEKSPQNKKHDLKEHLFCRNDRKSLFCIHRRKIKSERGLSPYLSKSTSLRSACEHVFVLRVNKLLKWFLIVNQNMPALLCENTEKYT